MLNASCLCLEFVVKHLPFVIEANYISLVYLAYIKKFLSFLNYHKW